VSLWCALALGCFLSFKLIIYPLISLKRFKTGANAVQHVESGYCSGCLGRDNARQQIYQFAQQQGAMQRFMSERPMITNGAFNSGVPDFPYCCNQCNKLFRNLSQLMQHQDQRHNNTRMLGY
jgi:hypothetical protein